MEKSAITSAKKRSPDKDREVQDLAFLKQIKRAAESVEKRAARLNEAAGNLYSFNGPT